MKEVEKMWKRKKKEMKKVKDMKNKGSILKNKNLKDRWIDFIYWDVEMEKWKKKFLIN